MRITRRMLLKGAVAVGSGLALGQLPALKRRGVAHATSGPSSASTPAVLYDMTQCAGCKFCEIACQINKGLTPDKALLTFRTAKPDDYPKTAFAVRRQQCMHCLDAACASICPVAAMYKTPEGPVIYKDERCLGCRYCMNACPFGVPTFDWDSGLLDGALIRKCDFCYDRQKAGQQPACIDACPTKAVMFGKRDELLAQAKERIKQNPDRYVDHIYGEHEAGGTSFLLLSGTPFDQLGLPTPGDKALPPLSEKVMGYMPPFMLGWTALLVGTTWAIRWREKRMNENGAHKGTAGKEAGK